MKKIDVNLNGYKWDRDSFPTKSGLYVIYTTKKKINGKYGVDELVYVGISNDIDRRKITAQPVEGKANKQLIEYQQIIQQKDQKLSEYESKLAEAAIVSKCKPKGNQEYINGYPDDFDRVQLNISGDHKGIPDIITIK